MKSCLKIAFPLMLLLPVVLGCALAEKFKQKIEQKIEKTGQPKVLTAFDGSCQVTIPDQWKSTTAQTEGALIRASHFLEDANLMVVKEDKKDFDPDITIEDYTDLVRQDVTTKLEGTEFTEVSKSPVNSFDGRSFEVTGTIQKVRIKYLQIVIATPEEFFRLVFWSVPSKYEKSRPAFLSMISSFKVIPPGEQTLEENEDAPPPPPPTPASPAVKKK